MPLLKACATHVQLMHDPKKAVAGAEVVVTDTWAEHGSGKGKGQTRQGVPRVSP